MGSSISGVLGRHFSAAPARSPGPLGCNDAADPNVLACMMGDTPGPLGTGGDHASQDTPALARTPRRVALLLFDLEKVARFLRSVAVAKAQQHYTRIDWEQYDGSTVLDVVYALMPWKGRPGTAVIIQGETVQVFARAAPDADHLLEVFLAKCSEGPPVALGFLEQQEQIRTQALASLQDVFRQASEINQEVIAKTADGVKQLAGIKCGADLIVTSLGVATGGLAPFVTGLGYSLAKDFAKGKDADAIGLTVATNVGKEGADKAVKAGTQAASDAIVPRHLQGMDPWDARAAIARKRSLIDHYQRELVGKGPSKRARLSTTIRLRQAEVKDLGKAASVARQRAVKGLKFLGRGVAFVFAAKDAYDSVTELAESRSRADQ